MFLAFVVRDTLRFSNYVISLTRALIHTHQCTTALVLSLLPSNRFCPNERGSWPGYIRRCAESTMEQEFYSSDWDFKGRLYQ